MQSSWLFLNIDELFYRLHLLLEWVWYFLSLQWIFGDSSAARNLEQGGLGPTSDAGFFDRFFSSGIFRIVSSRPSTEYDSIQETLNPTADKNFIELLWGILSGTGDKESVLQILFGTFFGWVLILAIIGLIFKKFLADKIHFMEHRHSLLYDMAQEKYSAASASNKGQRWSEITAKVQTDDVNQWKIAIMDGDILLDEVLSEQGFTGATVAEKLQDAQKNPNLSQIQHAWNAHQVRNKIAHDSAYVLTHREAKSAISMFERFFNELYHL